MRLMIKATSESNPMNNPNEDEDQSRGCRLTPRLSVVFDMSSNTTYLGLVMEVRKPNSLLDNAPN